MKIIADQLQRQYELTFLVPTSYAESEASKIKQEVQDLATKLKGKVDDSQDWGKKRLAYKIKRKGKTHEEAYYFHLVITFNPQDAYNFEKDLYLNQKIFRHLLVVANDDDKGPIQEAVEEK